MPGRTKLTPEVHTQILNFIRLGNFRKHAAQAAGIDEKTMKNWMRWGQLENPKEPYGTFAAEVLKAENEAISNNVLYVQSAAAQDWKAAKYFLERKAPQEWGDKAKQGVKAQLEFILQVVEDVCGQQTAARIYTEIATRAGAEESAEAQGESAPELLN